jgi:hypothetical protein
VRTRYNYLGETTIEVVIDGDCVEVNLLPPGPVPAPAPALLLTPDPVPVAAPLELCASAPAPTPRQRTSKGVIRAVWTAVFSFGGEALVYGLNNLTALNLPPGVGLAVGAVGYGAKAAIFPNTKL